MSQLCREDTAKRIKFLAEFSETSFSQVTDLYLQILRDGGLFEQVLKPEKSPGRKNGMLAKVLEGKSDGNVSVFMSHINLNWIKENHYTHFKARQIRQQTQLRP